MCDGAIDVVAHDRLVPCETKRARERRERRLIVIHNQYASHRLVAALVGPGTCPERSRGIVRQLDVKCRAAACARTSASAPRPAPFGDELVSAGDGIRAKSRNCATTRFKLASPEANAASPSSITS